MSIFKKTPAGEESEKKPGFIARLKRRFHKKQYYEQTVTLNCIDRTVDDDGNIEYTHTAQKSQICELPTDAVHVTGNKAEYAVVTMAPDYPEWAENCEGFDAYGYFLYYNDTRIKDAYEAIADFDKYSKMDWKKILVIVAAALIIIGVMLKFVM